MELRVRRRNEGKRGKVTRTENEGRREGRLTEDGDESWEEERGKKEEK